MLDVDDVSTSSKSSSGYIDRRSFISGSQISAADSTKVNEIILYYRIEGALIDNNNKQRKGSRKIINRTEGKTLWHSTSQICDIQHFVSDVKLNDFHVYLYLKL